MAAFFACVDQCHARRRGPQVGYEVVILTYHRALTELSLEHAVYATLQQTQINSGFKTADELNPPLHFLIATYYNALLVTTAQVLRAIAWPSCSSAEVNLTSDMQRKVTLLDNLPRGRSCRVSFVTCGRAFLWYVRHLISSLCR